MTAFDTYLATLRKNLAQGDSTEHTHRAALARLVEELSPGVTAVNEAQRIACGAPGLSLRKGKTPLGHIDASCECMVCARYTRAYLRHLYSSGEPLALTLNSVHNLHFYLDTMERVQKDIAGGES